MIDVQDTFGPEIEWHSEETNFPGNPQAGYEEELDDEQAQMPNESPRDPHFYDNLALYLEEDILSQIGNYLGQAIDSDWKAEERWRQINKEGIDYLGIGSDKPKGSVNAKDSNVYSSTLMTLSVKSTAKVHGTFFPANDLVDTEIIGELTEEIEALAERRRQFNNYFIRQVATEYIPDKKQAFFWMILEGSVFFKVYYDKIKKRPVSLYVRSEDIFMNPGASSIEDAERITYRFPLSARELYLRQQNGEYKSVSIEEENNPEQTIKQKADFKVGIDQPYSDEYNKIYLIDECLAYYDIPGLGHKGEDGQPDGMPLPYRIIKDKKNNKILGIYRNWAENDPDFKRKDCWVQYKYFTGFNAKGLGLFHFLLGYAKAETTIQQQLIQAGLLSNAPVLAVASGSRQEKTQYNAQPGSMINMNNFASNLPQSVMPLPFKGPDGTLLQLKETITKAMEDVVIGREVKPDALPVNMTATSMVGVLNTMHIFEDSIMNDLYMSLSKELELLNNLFAEWVPNEPYPFTVPGGEYAIMRQDFTPNIAIRPSVDPNASNTTIQLVINDAIMQLATQNPNLFDMKAVITRVLKSMKVSEIDKLFKQEEQPPQIPDINPVTENQMVTMGQPIKAYKWQDHQAHKMVHSAYMQQLSQDQSQDHSQQLAALQAHMTEHTTFEYIGQMEAMMGMELPEDPTQLSPEDQNHIAMQAAQALMQKQEEEQANQPPPPPSPEQVMMEESRVKEKQIDIEAQFKERQAQVEEMKIQNDIRLQQMKTEIELKRLELEYMKLSQEEKDKDRKHQLDLAKIQKDMRSDDLQAEGKAFDATLRYEKENKPTEELKI